MSRPKGLYVESWFKILWLIIELIRPPHKYNISWYYKAETEKNIYQITNILQVKLHIVWLPPPFGIHYELTFAPQHWTILTWTSSVRLPRATTSREAVTNTKCLVITVPWVNATIICVVGTYKGGSPNKNSKPMCGVLLNIEYLVLLV